LLIDDAFMNSRGWQGTRVTVESDAVLMVRNRGRPSGERIGWL